MSTKLNIFDRIGELETENSLFINRLLGDDRGVFEGIETYNRKDFYTKDIGLVSQPVSIFEIDIDINTVSDRSTPPNQFELKHDRKDLGSIIRSEVLQTKLLSTSKSNVIFGWIGEGAIDKASTTLQTPTLDVCSCPACIAAADTNAPQEAASIPSNDSRINALLGGYKWGTTNIKYSFFSGGTYYGSEANVAPISEAAKTNVRYILTNAIAPLINVNFTEVADSASSYGQIRYQLSTTPSYAYAYYPTSTDTNQGNANDRAGDVFFNTTYDYAGNTNGIQNGAGSHGYQTIIHETLHALGLKHPGNYNSTGSGDPPFLPYGEDNWDNSLMTYNFKSGAEPSTLMAYDVLALQYLYGAKTSTNSGNTTYTFAKADSYNDGSQTIGSSSLSNKLTIWDGGGTDTLNYATVSASASGYRFDLNEGGWLSTQSAYNGSTYNVNVGPPVSYISGTTYTATTFGSRIAFGVTIENLVNSSSNDYIIANSAANVFSGYGTTTATGADTIEGANNLDTLNLSAFTSASVSQTQSGNNLLLGLGSGKSITIKDYYLAQAANRINVQFASVGTTLAIAATSANKNEGSSGLTEFTFTITRSGDTSLASSVSFAVTGSGTNPANSSDFSGSTLPSGTISFSAGSTTAVLTINIAGDAVVEPNETFTVTLSNPTNATITTATATGTITNDDLAAPTLAISATDASKNEGNSGLTAFIFTIARSGDTSLASSVSFTVTGSGANPANASDFSGGTLPSGTVSFAAGSTTAVLTVNISSDTISELNETFTVTLSNPTNATITTATATGTIANDDAAAPTLAIAATSANKNEGNSGLTAFIFTITRSGDTSLASSVSFAVTGSGTNPANASDFSGGALPAGTISFSAGSTTAVLTVNVAGDTVVEPNETFTVTLSNPTNATITTATATGTITNDDVAAPTLAISATDANKNEGNSGLTPFTFTIARSGDTSASSSVNFAVTGSGTNSANGSDFSGSTLPSGTISFSAGSTTAILTVNVAGDAVVEPNETFTVTLSNPTNATITTTTATGTIANDDVAAPTLAISATDANKNEGNSGLTPFTFTITRSGNTSSSSSVSFAVTGSGTNPANASDFSGGTLPSGTVSFSAGSTSAVLTVNISSDTIAESNEAFTVTLSNPTNATITTAAATGTITNDDANSLAIAINNGETLQLSSNEQINNLADLTLNGGTLILNGFSETLDLLTVTTNSSINFGSGNSNFLAFSASSGQAWTGIPGILNITNWTPSKVLKFGINANGLTQSQLNQIRFAGFNPGAQISSTGIVTPLTTSPSTRTKLDSNGDGNSDIIYRDQVTGSNRIWILDSNNVTNDLVLPAISANFVFQGSGDFNGDNKGDILYRDPITGQNTILLLNGTSPIAQVAIPSAGTNFIVQGLADFNADNKDDILFRDPVTGQNAIWLLDGVNVTLQSFILSAGTNFSIQGTGDFNGDNKADILFRDQTTGQNAIWFLDGVNVTLQSLIDSASTNFQIQGNDDFNGDGKDDILFRDPTTGDNAIWLQDGLTSTIKSFIASATTNFKIDGTGDFNADGKADIFFRDPLTGQGATFLMNGTALIQGNFTSSYTGSSSLRAISDLNGNNSSEVIWRDPTTGINRIWFVNNNQVTIDIALPSSGSFIIQSSADFNGDNKADILFRDQATGENAIWLMNGATPVVQSLIDSASTNFEIKGTGDFNGDGKADILFRDPTTGQNAIWLVDGLSAPTKALVGLPSPDFQIQGTGDFNGDGKDDILFRNQATGENAIWLMDGVNPVVQSLTASAGTNFQVKGVGDFNADSKADVFFRDQATGQNAIWLFNGITPTVQAFTDPASTNFEALGVGDFNGDSKADILYKDPLTGQGALWFVNGTAITSKNFIDSYNSTLV